MDGIHGADKALTSELKKNDDCLIKHPAREILGVYGC